MDTRWTSAIEGLVKSLGEKALSLAWLHTRSEKRYSYLNNFMTIPSIILSTIVATIGGIFAGYDNASYASSVVSIVVSVLSTLNSYFLFAKRAEAHRITSISYSKLYLQISIELALPREKRMRVKDFLKVVSEQIQRLNEIQPQISDKVILEYNKKFKNEPPTISKPECVNGLVDIKVYLEHEQPTFLMDGAFVLNPPPAPPSTPVLPVKELPPPEEIKPLPAPAAKQKPPFK